MESTAKKIIGMATGLASIGLFRMSAFAQSAVPTLLPRPTDQNISAPGGKCIGLAEKIQSGDIHLEHISCFIKYIAQTLIALGGTIAVIMVMVGGYHYILEGEEGKESGKKSIKYALIGLAISLLAWVIVDLVLRLATE